MYTNYSSRYSRRREYYLDSYKMKALGLGLPMFNSAPLVGSYPSYLGIPIFDVDKKYTGEALFGLTDSRLIIRRRNLPRDLAEFVLLHEEEHVKDMSASEWEVDRRALRRFVIKHDKIANVVAGLLERRWGERWKDLEII